jgi:two-component system OmpR family response regulator
MAKTTKKQSKETKRILVVDDEGQIGLVMDMILNESQFQMDYAYSLLSADEYLQKHEPAVVILDNKLPDGFGVDYISYIKKKYPSIKIIMISGFGSVRDVALENGADVFFEKPFALDEFNKALNSLVQKG